MPWSKEKDFREKLSKLSESQQSIQTLSHWVAFHKANAAHAANVWADEAQRAVDPHRQLLLVYLANDVMQNSRRKGTPCADAFASQMATVLPAAHAAATPTVGGLYDEKPHLPPAQRHTHGHKGRRGAGRARSCPCPRPSAVGICSSRTAASVPLETYIGQHLAPFGPTATSLPSAPPGASKAGAAALDLGGARRDARAAGGRHLRPPPPGLSLQKPRLVTACAGEHF